MDRMDRSCIAGDHTDTSFFYTLECFQDVVVTLSDCSYGNTATNVSTIEFSPLLFGSLFTKTPREEFSLLIDALSYDKKILSNLNVGTMLERWGLEDVADKQFHQLSGGYRKYVLVATQVEALKNNGHVVAINIQQQLDIMRFRFVEAVLIEKGLCSVLWVDDNPTLLKQKSRLIPRQTTLSDWLSRVNSI